MLFEGDVIEAVCKHLELHGYTITQRLSVSTRGVDIVAVKGPVTVHVEAKGAGSSKEGSPRSGKSFDPSQVFAGVAKAVLKALRAVSLGNVRAAIALPATRLHIQQLDQVRPALQAAGVAVFLVDESHQVSVESPWPL